MPREHNPELRILLPDHVPSHVVCADGHDPPFGEPVGGARRHTRRYLLDAALGEAFPRLYLLDGDATVEHEVIGLVADGVYVSTGVLHADYDAKGAGTWLSLFVSILVVAM